MEGGDKPDGLCYRSFDELFQIRDQRCESGRITYTIRVSMLEIYNEQVALRPRAVQHDHAQTAVTQPCLAPFAATHPLAALFTRPPRCPQ